jgi:hypothetical protein
MEAPHNLNATTQTIESNENKMSCRVTTIPGSSSPFYRCQSGAFSLQSLDIHVKTSRCNVRRLSGEEFLQFSAVTAEKSGQRLCKLMPA